MCEAKKKKSTKNSVVASRGCVRSMLGAPSVYSQEDGRTCTVHTRRKKSGFFLLLPQVVLALVKWQCYCFVAMNWLIRQPALFRYTRHTLWACNTESHQQQLSACSTYAPHRTHHLGHPYRTRVCVCSVLCVLYGFDITYMNMFSNFPSISVSMVMAQFCHTSMYYDITEWIPLKHFHMPWIFVYFISFIFFF